MRPRPHRCLILLLLIALGEISFAQVHSPATSQSTTQISELNVSGLLHRLGADSFKDRQLAENELVTRGEPALAALRDTIKTTTDAEVRSRCETAIERIADELAIGPTRVTLHLKETPAIEAYAELARQAQVELRPYPANLWAGASWGSVTLDLDRQPFWEAVKQLSEQTGLGLRSITPDELRLTARGRAARPIRDAPACDNVAVSGPFIITASRIARSNSIDLEQGDDQGDFSVTVSVLAEPKLRVLRADPIVLQVAEDDAGNSLLPHMPIGTRHGLGSAAFAQRGLGSWQTTIKLREPPREKTGTRIGLLKAAMVVTLQTRADTVEIADLLNAHDVEASIAGIDFVMNELRRSERGEYELRMTLAGAGRSPNDLEAARQKLSGSTLRLFTAEGRPLVSRGSDQKVVDGRIELTWTFVRERNAGRPGRELVERENAALPNMKLTWEIPIDSKRVNVPFEFRDLPIP